MTPLSIMQDGWDPLGLHLKQKYLKSGKKLLRYWQFTDGRLHNLSEYHAGCIGFISLEPKISKIG